MLSHLFAITLVLFSLPGSSSYSAQVVTIQGRVSGPGNKGLENARVILMNDSYSPLQTTYTSAAGRYTFKVGPGFYYIQVEPFEADLQRQQQRVDAMSPFGGNQMYNIDFMLKAGSSGSGGLPPGIRGGPVFTQEVPEPARREFDKAKKSLEKNDASTGAASLKVAIEAFPDYYDALDLLGEVYINQQQYDSATPVLKHALEVNPKGWHSYYLLGVALSETKQINDGVAALRKAIEIYPDAVKANLKLGMILGRSDATREEAIKSLKRVTELAGKQMPESYLYLASLYDKNKQYREAADAVEAALKYVPESEKEKRNQLKQLVENLRKKAS